MVVAFSGGENIVVATHATADHLCVVHTGNRNPGGTAMTGRAVIGRGNMIICFTTGNGIVMAADACANDIGVINCVSRYPSSGIMTGVATVRGIDMAVCFATGIDPVVAADTGLPHYFGMIKYSHRPGIDAVAPVAFQLCRYVGRTFTRSRNAVMTGRTRQRIHKAVVHSR